jgi:predicted nucleic acid-binding protein
LLHHIARDIIDHEAGGVDTDVVEAALRSPTGASAQLLRLARSGGLQLLANVGLFLEYEAVLMRPDQLLATQRGAASMRLLLDELGGLIEPVEGWFRWRPQLKDPGDEMVLEAAVNGRAEALITFNIRDYGQAPARFGLLLLRPGELLRILLS